VEAVLEDDEVAALAPAPRELDRALDGLTLPPSERSEWRPASSIPGSV
jgi:hypothetical protein